MTPLRTISLAALVAALAAGAAYAQPRATMPPSSTTAASQPQMGMGQHKMTAKEREQHRKEMHAAKGDADCKAMMDKRHKMMAGQDKDHDMKMADGGKAGDCPAMK